MEASTRPNSSKMVSRYSIGMPMPVSATLTTTQPSSRDTDTATRPCSVYLTALVNRLSNTCRTRVLSARITGKSGSSICTSSMGRCSMSVVVMDTASSTSSGRSTSPSFRSILPAQIWLMSSTLLISSNRCLPPLKMASRSSRCGSVSGPSISFNITPEKPMIALSGVRSS